MVRLFGICKVAAALALNFIIILNLSGQWTITALVTGGVALYVWLGGYLSLFKEGAVKCDKLPLYDKTRLHVAKCQLVRDVQRESSVDLSGLRLYLIPGDDDMQATAYGANCVSVARGTLDNTDPVTLNAVLAHEASHILHYDPEFSRAVFASVTLVVAALGLVSFVFMILIFVLFLVLSVFRSWLGVMAFQGTTKMVGGFFGLIQRSIVALYQTLMCLASRQNEYRCDLYACSLGYGVQLAHFLTIAAPDTHQRLTFTEALYRTHPATKKRITRLEQQLGLAKRQ